MISRAQFVRAAGLAVFLLMSTNTLGFKIMKPPIHEDITRRGLSTVLYEVSDSKLMFTPAVMDEIANANRLVDLQYVLDAARHFDNEHLLESLILISQLKESVVGALESRPYFSAFAAREFLGEAMHTMQDFYSHSTWVESGNPRIVNFYNLVGALDLEESPVVTDGLNDFRRNPVEIGTVCSPGTGDIVFGGKLTTGYFEIIGDDIPEDLRSIGKCIHGTPFSCSTEGINKDKDCPHNSSAHFLAKGLAIKETQVFTQSIIDELVSTRNIDGICALMGISEEDCPELEQEPEQYIPDTASFFIGTWGCNIDGDLFGLRFNSDGSGLWTGLSDFTWSYASNTLPIVFVDPPAIVPFTGVDITQIAFQEVPERFNGRLDGEGSIVCSAPFRPRQ